VPTLQPLAKSCRAVPLEATNSSSAIVKRQSSCVPVLADNFVQKISCLTSMELEVLAVDLMWIPAKTLYDATLLISALREKKYQQC